MSVHVIVSGRVQGVSYRAWVQHIALRDGLEGWVRNRNDGTVEALFVGSPESVAMMIAACGEGPSAARVAEVAQRPATTQDQALRRAGERFSVLPTV